MALDPIIKEDIDNIIEAVGSEFNLLAGKTVLVTGANGFLPSYFVDTILELNRGLLAKNPAKIIALVRRPIQVGDRLAHCLNNDGVAFLHQDVGKKFVVPKGVDYIIHGASRATPKDYLADTIDTIDANVSGVRTLLEYGKQNLLQGIIFISSSEVYGDPNVGQPLISETYFGNVNPIGSRSAYQESKRFAETLCYNFWKAYQVPAKIARCFLTYGPRMRLHDGRVISDFMYNGLAGEDIEMKGGLGFERAFSYVSDTIEQFWRVLLLGKSGEAYNVGSDEVMTIPNLAELIIKIFDNRLKVRVVGENSQIGTVTAPKKVAPNLSKIREDLGYAKKSISIENGLRRMKQWYELYSNSTEVV